MRGKDWRSSESGGIETLTTFPIICNGTPKSGTHALLQAVEAMGFNKYAFVRGLRKDKPCYGRRIDYNEESIFLSPEAKRNFDNYLKNTPKVTGRAEVAALLRAAPAMSVVHAHVSWRKRDILRDLTTVTIIRNPRNNFISWLRWFGPEAAAEFFPTYASFLSWRKDKLFVYERLWEPTQIVALGKAVGRDIDLAQANEIVDKSKNRSLTWTNQPSNHEIIWNPQLAEVWKAHRGERLDAAYEQIAAESDERFVPLDGLRHGASAVGQFA